MGDDKEGPTLQRGWDARKKMSCAATKKAKEAKYKTKPVVSMSATRGNFLIYSRAFSHPAP